MYTNNCKYIPSISTIIIVSGTYKKFDVLYLHLFIYEYSYNYKYTCMNNLTYFNYSYTCTYYFVSTPNPPAVKSLTIFFLENFLFCLPPPEIG